MVTDSESPLPACPGKSKFARCWFDRAFRPRDFALAVALGLAAIGAAPLFADGGAGGNGNAGAGGDANGGAGGGGTGTVGANDNGQPGSGGNGGTGGSSYSGALGGAGGSVGTTTFSGVSVNGGTGGNGNADPGVGFGGGGGGGGGDAVYTGQTGLNITGGGSLRGGNGGRGGEPNRIAGGGGAGGGGLTATSDGTVINNAGTIAGGLGGDGGGLGGQGYFGGGGGAGGDGLRLLGNGSELSNTGTISGGAGGSGGDADFAGSGGDGGAGVNFLGDGATLINDGTITGGNGGTGGNLGFSDLGEGGDGGVGIRIQGNSADMTNSGTVTGGIGGDGGLGGPAGDGGIGIWTQGSLTNSGTITGGDGGDSDVLGGDAGHGVSFHGTTITNQAGGTITGGNGGATGQSSAATGGRGGIGVMLQSGQLVNDGTIQGGDGGQGFFSGAGGNGVAAEGSTVINGATGTITGGNGAIAAGGAGSVNGIGGPGVTLSNSTLINHGTITGGDERAFGPAGSGIGAGVLAGNSTIVTSGVISGGIRDDAGNRSDAVTFGTGTNRLELHAGATFQGNATALHSTRDTFTLGGATNGTFDAGSIGDAVQFRGFEQFEKTGASTWSLTGTPTATVTPWTIFEGTLAVNGGLHGSVDVLAAGTLGGVGTITGDVTNSGVVAPGNSIGTLLVDGNYAGSGGRLEVEAVLGDDGFAADRLLVSGDVSGTTPVLVLNQGGAGAATGTTSSDGASIIQVGGNSGPDAFRLVGEYVAVGPYRYDLHAFAPGTSSAGELDPRLAATGTTSYWDYRLQSALDETGRPIAVPQIAAYQALAPAVLQYGWAVLDNLHSRLGEIRHFTTVRDHSVERSTESFFRVRGWNGEFDGDRGPDFEQDLWFLQTGLNLVELDLRDTGDSLRLGLAFDYGRSQLAVPQPGGLGPGGLEGESIEAGLEFESPALALTGTYQAVGGWYVDTVLRGASYDVTASTSARGQVADFNGAGFGASVETGYPVLLAERLIFEPQLQVGYQRNWFDAFTDVDGVTADLHDNHGLRGRLGGRLQKTFVGRSEDQLWSPFLTADVLQGFLDDGSLTAGGVDFQTDTSSTSLMFGGGLNAQLGQRWSLYSSAAYLHGLSQGNPDHAWTGNGGLRLNF